MTNSNVAENSVNNVNDSGEQLSILGVGVEDNTHAPDKKKVECIEIPVSIIKALDAFIDKNDMRPYLRGIQYRDGMLFASDGKCLACFALNERLDTAGIMKPDSKGNGNSDKNDGGSNGGKGVAYDSGYLLTYGAVKRFLGSKEKCGYLYVDSTAVRNGGSVETMKRVMFGYGGMADSFGSEWKVPVEGFRTAEMLKLSGEDNDGVGIAVLPDMRRIVGDCYVRYTKKLGDGKYDNARFVSMDVGLLGRFATAAKAFGIGSQYVEVMPVCDASGEFVDGKAMVLFSSDGNGRSAGVMDVSGRFLGIIMGKRTSLGGFSSSVVDYLMANFSLDRKV